MIKSHRTLTAFQQQGIINCSERRFRVTANNQSVVGFSGAGAAGAGATAGVSGFG